MSTARTRLLSRKLLRGTPYSIVVRNELVVLQIKGEDVLVLDTDEAVRMCLGLRHGVRIARKNKGEKPKLFGFADLTDAVADELELQKSRDGTAVFAKVR